MEVLVAVALFGLLGTSVTLLLTAALRGAKKSGVTADVRGEGVYAVEVMTRLLRYADKIQSCNANNVTFVAHSGENPTSFACQVGYIASGAARLTSTSVTTTSCQITCSPVLDEVDIDFTLSQSDVSALNEAAASVNFQTQVNLRNK